MVERSKINSPEQENILFNQHLKKISDVLNQRGIKYSLVGGLALNGILEKEIPARRKNGSRVDLDAVAIGPDRKTIDEALKELEPYKKEPMFPELGVEPIHFGDQKIAHNPLTLLSTMRKNDEKYFLVFRDLEVEVPAETMKLREVLVNGVPFSCFSDKTILFRYLTRNGLMKPKDDEKLHELEDYIIDHWNEETDDKLYKPYLYFAEQLRERYPIAKLLTEGYWLLDHSLRGKISGMAGVIYGSIRIFRN